MAITASYFVPNAIGVFVVLHGNRQDVDLVEVGATAMSPFGRPAMVTKVYARGVDVNGKAYVCFYVEHGENGGAISNSLKEGELVRTVQLSFRHDSATLDRIEARAPRNGT
jgi:hypothetical protein